MQNLEKFVYRQNLHTHCTYCDGKNTLEELIKSALDLGFDSIGFSSHAYQEGGEHYCMAKDADKKYIAEINVLKEKYKGIIDIFLGVECGYYSQCDLAPYDYVIGSLHCVNTCDGILSIDTKMPEILEGIIDKYFDGEPLKLVKHYFEEFANIKNKLKRVDIIGHFDLFLKSSEIKKVFDTDDVRYRKYALDSAKTLIEQGCIFEVNTGAIMRQIRTSPYPEQWLLKEICQMGGIVVISSDCHFADKLNCFFDGAVNYVRESGFKEVYVLTKDGFVPQKI